MYRLKVTSQFKRDLKKVKTRPKDFALVTITLKQLQNSGVDGIDPAMRPHKLKGNYSDNWECHIKLDLLIIWIQIEHPKVIKLIRLGSHSDLFG